MKKVNSSLILLTLLIGKSVFIIFRSEPCCRRSFCF